MPVSVTMPQLGESVVEGTVTRWLKKEGDQVVTDEPLLEVSTDKVDTEIPSPAAGVLLRIVAVEDETVAVGAELAVIGAANESAAEPAEPAQEPEPDQGSPDQGSPDQGAPEQGAPERPVAAVADTVPALSPEVSAPNDQHQAQAATPDEPHAAAEASPSAEPNPPAPAAVADPGAGPTTSLTLPALGESVTEGTVTRWLKQVGDAVAVDEALLEVSTDKVDTEIPSPVAGILLSITVADDQTVNVGGELAVIGPAGGAAPANPPSPAPPEEQAQAVAPPQQSEPPAEPAVAEADHAVADDAVTGDEVADADRDGGYVTPLVRKLASEYAVDLASVSGTGIGGRIRKQDVLEAAKHVARQASSRAEPTAAESTQAPRSSASEIARPSSAQASPLRGRTEKMSRLRKVIAERMVESLQVSAQLTTVVEVDVTRIAHLRQRAKDTFLTREGVKLSFLPFFAKATVEALKVHPSVNANIDSSAGTVTYHDVENLGVAVDTERGLLVPVIHQAGDLNIAGLAKRIADVAERTRGGKISPDELSGGTFTLTNTGSRGALFDTPIINQPQVGVLGTGVVVKRPVVVSDSTGDDSIAIRWMVFLALTYDHRLVDGADATRFLTTIKDRLEEGAFEADLGL